MSTISLASHIRNIIGRVNTQLSESEKNIYVASSLAFAIAQNLPLPSSPVQLLHTYYASSHDKQICDIINEVNEQYVIDTRMCRDLVFKWYSLRYELVYSPNAYGHILLKMGGFMDEYFPQEVTNLLTKTNTNDVEVRLTVTNAWDDVRRAIATHIQNKYSVQTVAVQQ
jgi:hypothetical protein